MERVLRSSKAGTEDATWWEIANHNRFWRPLVAERGISERLLSGTNGNFFTVLRNCKWAEICFSYYRQVLTNWAKQRCKITKAPDSTDTTEIHLPYMVRVFEPPDHHFVEILELKGGDFVPLDKIRLPSDPSSDISYDLTMNKNNVFVVYEWNKAIIFKLSNGSFRFDRALFFLDTGEFVSCFKESEIGECLRLYSSMEQIFPVAVSEEIIWMYWLYPTFVVKAIYAWNYIKSEWLLSLHPSSISPFPTLSTSDKYISWFFDSQFLVYSLDGKKLFQQGADEIIKVEWTQSGCGFISLKDGRREASYVDFLNPVIVALDVEDPLAIALHGSERLAYCLCKLGKQATIACASTLTGELKWQTIISKSKEDLVPPLDVKSAPKMCVIHGKHLVIHDINVFSENIFTNYALSLYSASDGQLEWCHRFAPYNASIMVNHLSDHFIMIVSEDPDDIANNQRLTLAEKMMKELIVDEEQSLALARAIVEAWAANEKGFSVNLLVDTTKQFLEQKLNLVAPNGVHVRDMHLSFAYEFGPCIKRSIAKVLKLEHQRGNYIELRIDDPFKTRVNVWDPYEVGEANCSALNLRPSHQNQAGSTSKDGFPPSKTNLEMDCNVASILANCEQCSAQDEIMAVCRDDHQNQDNDDDESEDFNMVSRRVRIYNFLSGDQRL
ncbi:hypothetical protein GE061_004488 [Apolygus lucorum]|uniref:Uncharacterized protein n=1 Tax=Apolygus lucorum TaxID=248454 RepID=A0A8S9X1A3_APOLU|nr:hypothetical protein GE061_004488 [Apolygus lucorum]